MKDDRRKKYIIDRCFNFLHYWLENEDLDFDEAYETWRQKKQDEQEESKS